MRIKLTLTFLLLLFIKYSQAAIVDTIETYSQLMNKKIKAVVIRPDSYKDGKRFPVVYLLHGHGGNYANWVTAGKVANLADDDQMIIVCADGNVSSWYFDSPVDKQWKYESYITTELIPYIDKNYNTIADRTKRAITGLSMGGHGALYLAFKHQDLFGAAGSTSGGVDIRSFPESWHLADRLGSYATHPENWEKNTVINMLSLLTPNRLKLIIDCGTEDFFYKVNCNLHEQLLYRNIPHDFITRPGTHNWAYWSNSIKYQLLFMHNYFASVDQK